MIRMVGLAAVITVLLTILRKDYAPFGFQVALGFVVALMIWLLRPLSDLIGALGTLAQTAGVRSVYLNVVLKVVGIATVTSIGAALCRDAGEDAIGHVVELTGKVFILILAIPVVAAIIDVIVGLLPG